MPTEEHFRTAMSGALPAGLDAGELESLMLAMDAIDKALADADELVLSYGIPDTVHTSLLARITSTIALYYLQGSERQNEDVSKAYDGVIDTLKAHASGKLSLIPIVVSDNEPQGMGAEITSGSQRYGAHSGGFNWDSDVIT